MQKWGSIQKSIACQLSDCFREFCKEYNLRIEWIVFYRSVNCINTEHQKSTNISEIFRIIEDRSSQLDEFERGSAEALSAAYALQKDDEKSYKEGVGSFCHFLGGLNIQYRNLDLDWIDPSTELDPTFSKYIEHYIDFLSEEISEEHLMAMCSLFSINEIVLEIYPKSLP